MERRGYIEDDDGFLRGYEVLNDMVYRNGDVVGYIERVRGEDIAYKRNPDGLPFALGTVFWAESE